MSSYTQSSSAGTSAPFKVKTSQRQKRGTHKRDANGKDNFSIYSKDIPKCESIIWLSLKTFNTDRKAANLVNKDELDNMVKSRRDALTTNTSNVLTTKQLTKLAGGNQQLVQAAQAPKIWGKSFAAVAASVVCAAPVTSPTLSAKSDASNSSSGSRTPSPTFSDASRASDKSWVSVASGKTAAKKSSTTPITHRLKAQPAAHSKEVTIPSTQAALRQMTKQSHSGIPANEYCTGFTVYTSKKSQKKIKTPYPDQVVTAKKTAPSHEAEAVFGPTMLSEQCFHHAILESGMLLQCGSEQDLKITASILGQWQRMQKYMTVCLTPNPCSATDSCPLIL
jgi:hypothetical protein